MFGLYHPLHLLLWFFACIRYLVVSVSRSLSFWVYITHFSVDEH